MTFTVQAEAPPLREDASGALRIGQTRVLLDLVIHAFQDCAIPEAIAHRYSSLNPSDVYMVIAYYLRHRKDIDEYLSQRDQKAEKIKRRIESDQCDLSDIRARMLRQRER
jgi:uncharacterized protein (DUF433 family)